MDGTPLTVSPLSVVSSGQAEPLKVRHLWVVGEAVAQGSKQAIVNKSGSISMLEDKNRRDALAAFRSDIREVWHQVRGTDWPMAGAKAMRVFIYKRRPKGHFDSKGRLRASAPKWASSKPDADKYVRSVMDALTNHAYLDDGQVVELSVVKVYLGALDDVPGVSIFVFDLNDGVAPTAPTP